MLHLVQAPSADSGTLWYNSVHSKIMRGTEVTDITLGTGLISCFILKFNFYTREQRLRTLHLVQASLAAF